uniref:Uncharacterized protein n=1 Tax=Romanomermis culicivorax TaxID=13658 RepID=A0A915K5H6_ROMCU
MTVDEATCERSESKLSAGKTGVKSYPAKNNLIGIDSPIAHKSIRHYLCQKWKRHIKDWDYD